LHRHLLLSSILNPEEPIKSAFAIDDRTLLVEFSNAEKRKYDIAKLLKKEIFFPLKNAAFFKNFQVDSTGCAIVWNEASISVNMKSGVTELHKFNSTLKTGQ
jgi:hypothetical protein